MKANSITGELNEMLSNYNIADVYLKPCDTFFVDCFFAKGSIMVPSLPLEMKDMKMSIQCTNLWSNIRKNKEKKKQKQNKQQLKWEEIK